VQRRLAELVVRAHYKQLKDSAVSMFKAAAEPITKREVPSDPTTVLAAVVLQTPPGLSSAQMDAGAMTRSTRCKF
jgi:hypothetical protein